MATKKYNIKVETKKIFSYEVEYWDYTKFDSVIHKGIIFAKDFYEVIANLDECYGEENIVELKRISPLVEDNLFCFDFDDTIDGINADDAKWIISALETNLPFYSRFQQKGEM